MVKLFILNENLFPFIVFTILFLRFIAGENFAWLFNDLGIDPGYFAR